MNKVASVRPMLDGKVGVDLGGGRSGEIDVRPYMGSTFFRSLESPDYFQQVRIVFRGIGWPEGQDIGPDTIAAELK